MGILVLTSTAGAPGTTTTAVGLALAWPRPVLLVDADPGAHQAVLAGFLAGQTADGKGLLRVAEAHRDRRELLEVVVDQTIALTGDDEGIERRFLPGFARPGSAALFSGVWSDLMSALAALGDREMDVILDLGRSGAQGVPVAVAEQSHQTAVVLRSQLRAIVSARVNLGPLRDQLGGRGDQQSLGLLVVGPGQPYAATEIGAALGVPVLGTLADDPVAAGHLSDGRPRPRKFEQSPLTRSLHTVAADLCLRLDRSAALVRG